MSEMVHIAGVDDIYLWGGFIALVGVFLYLDLFVFHKKQHSISIKEALIWTVVWFSLAMVFNLFIWYKFGHDAAAKFFTGYLIEKALSVDNLFVILMIFTAFKIKPIYHHKILFWGILGAIFFRGFMIWAGSALVSRFEWLLYIFGAFLVYTGIKMFKKKEDDFDPHDSWIVKTIKKFFHVSRKDDVHHFTIVENGRRGITMLFVALMVIEVTDIVFAFDSIPAIFAITTDPFLVFTSNIFAILGLRSLYFVIAKAHDMFHYLNIGLAFILSFIGVKMLIAHWIHIDIFVSLGIVVSVLALSIIFSVLNKNKLEQKNAKLHVRNK